MYGDGGLHDNRAGIGSFIYKVYGASRDFNPVCQRLFLGVEAGKSREKRRMNVHHRMGESLQKDRRYDSHEAGQNHKPNPVGAKKIHKGDIVCFATGVGTMIEYMGGDAVAFRSFQGKGISFVTDDADHLRL